MAYCCYVIHEKLKKQNNGEKGEGDEEAGPGARGRQGDQELGLRPWNQYLRPTLHHLC